MKDSPSPPPVPDPTTTANAQTGSNIQTALANARLNRVNQSTPWGSLNYTQGPADASGVPTYSSQIQLSPAQQQLFDQQQAQQMHRGDIAATLLGQVGDKLGQPLDLSGIHPMYDRYAQGSAQNPAGAAKVMNPAARPANGPNVTGMYPGEMIGSRIPSGNMGGNPLMPAPTALDPGSLAANPAARSPAGPAITPGGPSGGSPTGQINPLAVDGNPAARMAALIQALRGQQS